MKSRKGAGSIRERNGRFEATVTVGRDADGKQRRAYATFDTRADAERWCAEKAMELGRMPTKEAGITLRMAWQAYKRERGPRLATKTMQAYAYYMEGTRRSPERSWLALMGDVDVSMIDLAKVQERLLTMTHNDATHARVALSSVLTWCVPRYLDANPLHGHRFDIPEDRRLSSDDDVWDDDPFGAIEETRDVWDAMTAVRCMGMIRGLPLEPVWLSCIGAGMRVEEAFALRGMDLRRVKTEIGGRKVYVTQAAVHHAVTDLNELKGTKNRGSIRIVSYLEPFGERMWELASAVERTELVCKASPANQNHRWRSYFEPEKLHRRMSKDRVVRGKLEGLPYIPLSKMRRSHETLLQEAGVLDSLNAAMHGHTERVAKLHYMRGDGTEATVAASERIMRVV